MKVMIFAVAVGFCLLAACSNERVLYMQNNPAAKIEGTVIAKRCGDSFPYGVGSGDTAHVKFIRANGFTFETTTDDSARLNLLVDPGIYMLEVWTPHSRPDTIRDVYISSDTALTIPVWFAYNRSRSLGLCFYPARHTEAEELQWLRRLNGLLGNRLDIAAAQRETRILIGLGPHVMWDTPLVDGFYTWQVYDQIKQVLRALDGNYPSGFYLDPGSITCPN